jgi:hypothetical protein
MSDGSFEVQFLHTGKDDVAQLLLGCSDAQCLIHLELALQVSPGVICIRCLSLADLTPDENLPGDSVLGDQ